MTTGIYIIRNILNDYFYYGSSVNIERRIYQHFYMALKKLSSKCPHLYSAIRKHGADSFVCKILISCNKEQLLEVEQKFLDGCINLQNCYNISSSAISPSRNISNETRKKISDAAKKRKQKINPKFTMRGKTHSEETKNLMSKTHKNRDHSYKIGKHHSEETKQKISKNNAKNNLGKKLSLETKLKISNSTRNKKLTVDQIKEIRFLKNEGWLNKNLAEKFNVHPSTISSIILHNKYKLI